MKLLVIEYCEQNYENIFILFCDESPISPNLALFIFDHLVMAHTNLKMFYIYQYTLFVFSASCDFEIDMCGYKKDSVSGWSRVQAHDVVVNATEVTNPLVDHTTDNPNGMCPLF